MRARKTWRIAVALVSIALPTAGCGKKKSAGPPPPPVEVGIVSQADVPLYVETFGNCATVASVTIVPQVTGILSKTLFREGDFVKASDPMFEIDPAPYRAALEQAQGNLKTAKANLLNAQQNLGRKENLYKTKVIDIQEFQDAQAAEQGAQGDVLASQAALETAQINLNYCSIASPIQGKTGIYLMNTGNLVTENQSQLVNIQTISPIYVDYTISEAQLPAIRKYLDEDGLDVEVTIPGDSDYKGIGKLTFLDNKVSADTGTLELRAQLPNEDQKLWPGQFVNVRLILKMLPNAIVAPATAVVVGQDGPYVFVLNADDTVSIRPVTRGQMERDRIVIEEGLKVGEKVVTSGQVALAPGAKVAPKPPAKEMPAQE